MLIKAILFDLDGVILDSEKVYFRFWDEAAKELGYSIEEDTILSLRSCDSSIARTIIEEATGDKDAYDLIRVRRKALMKAYMNSNDIELKDGIKEFLSSLEDYTVKKVIVTAASPDEKLPLLHKHGIDIFFDEIVSVKDVKRSKPYPDVYIYACKKLKLSPNDCLAIEDAPNGIKSAFDAGVNVVMVPDLSRPDDTILGMCTVVKDIKDILKLLN